MASISQLKLPDNTIYNIKGSIHTVIGTQNASTGSWTGNLTSIDALYDGLTIAYFLPYAGSDNATLNLTLKNDTATGPIDCYLNNNVRINTQYKEGSVIYLTYFSAGSISINGTATLTARWIAQMEYEMVMLSYGHSTWNDFMTAYSTNSLVYCRASSNSNPATGVQGRLAFMAFISLNSNNVPTNVEFQYYRSVSSHTASQQGDQVYIYKLENKGTNGTWTVTVREAMSKIEAGTGLSSSYSNGVITLSNTYSLPTASDSTLGGVKIDDSTIVIDNNGIISTSSDIATTSYVDTAVNSLPTPMQFIGTVGTDGTVTWANLATASSSNEGYTYKVITDHTAETGKPAAKSGDTIISNGTEWIVVPSGDEPSGTVTSVTLKAGTGVSLDVDNTAITSSGTRTIGLASAYGDSKNPYGTKTANYVLAGPTSGTATAPSFRKLVAADIPDLSSTYLTSYTETDPVFGASAAAGITSSDISNWNSKADGTHTHSEYINQNAFSNVKVGSTTIAADTTTDTLTLTAGSNITLTPDATNDKVIIAATDTTYSNATTSANGLMSATDKIKTDSLSGIYPVIGTQTAATASWTGTINASALYDGMTIAYYLPYAGVSSTSVTLNLTLSNGTTTGAINCYFNNATRLTTHYGAGSTILLTYWSAGSISVAGTATTDNRWTRCDYDSNTKNTAGSTNSTSKLFLIGATSQAANPTTYSRSTAYVGTDGHLYSNDVQVANLSGSQALTNKTYNGYTLAAACAKAVDTSISSTSSTNLPTTAAVTAYTDDIIVIDENEPTSALTKIWIKI